MLNLFSYYGDYFFPPDYIVGFSMCAMHFLFLNYIDKLDYY